MGSLLAKIRCFIFSFINDWMGDFWQYDPIALIKTLNCWDPNSSKLQDKTNCFSGGSTGGVICRAPWFLQWIEPLNWVLPCASQISGTRNHRFSYRNSKCPGRRTAQFLQGKETPETSAPAEATHGRRKGAAACAGWVRCPLCSNQRSFNRGAGLNLGCNEYK